MTVRGRDGQIQPSGRAEIPGERSPGSGPFAIELRVWDRDPDSMSELATRLGASTRLVRQDLNNAAGVSIYRDGFRVLPYGEPGDDWLQLDARRVNNPTLRFSNNQVVGYVLISRDQNPELRDQTNREGLLQNQAFDDLRRTVRSVIARLEEERYAVRPRERRGRPRAGGLFAGLNISALRAYASERYANDNELARLLGEAQQNLEEGVERAQEVVARYHRLATLGELIDKVLHDGRAPLAKIGGEAEPSARCRWRCSGSASVTAEAVRGGRVREQAIGPRPHSPSSETAEKVAALGDRVRRARSIAFPWKLACFGEVEGDAWGGGSAAGLLRRGVVL
jgi:hypothetical protein